MRILDIASCPCTLKMAKLLAFVLLAILAVASAQFGGPKRPKPKAPVNKDDIKYIQCQVCEAMAKETGRIVKDLSELAGSKKIREADILERLERMCNPDQNAGDWIAMHDIVEQGSALQLKDTGMVGKCKSECRTIARACELIAEDIDLTDLSAMLYKGKKRAAITNWMCYDATDACIKKAPPVPPGRPAGEAHEPLDEDELRNIMMMRDMEANGLSGTMYSRDTMMEELAEMQDLYGDDADFNRILAETGMDKFTPGQGRPEDVEPASADEPSSGTSSDTVAKLQETASQAAESIKKGAAKVMEGAKNVMGKMFGGSKRAEGGADL